MSNALRVDWFERDPGGSTTNVASAKDQAAASTHCGLCTDGDVDIRRDHACDVEDHWHGRPSRV